jgi:hypothetical protein
MFGTCDRPKVMIQTNRSTLVLQAEVENFTPLKPLIVEKLLMIVARLKCLKQLSQIMDLRGGTWNMLSLYRRGTSRRYSTCRQTGWILSKIRRQWVLEIGDKKSQDWDQWREIVRGHDLHTKGEKEEEEEEEEAEEEEAEEEAEEEEAEEEAEEEEEEEEEGEEEKKEEVVEGEQEKKEKKEEKEGNEEEGKGKKIQKKGGRRGGGGGKGRRYISGRGRFYDEFSIAEVNVTAVISEEI